MSIKAKVEAIIYAAEEPVSVDQIVSVISDAGLANELLAWNPVSMDSAHGGDSKKQSPSEEQSSPGREAETIDAEKIEEEKTDTQNPGNNAAAQDAPPALDEKSRKAALRAKAREVIDALSSDYATESRGMELRQIANGFRITTKPEHHDVVREFAKSLKPPIRLSLQALETLAVIAYKQPVTAPEIAEIRGVDASGVLATLIDRKLITTAGRKQVIGRPILYKTTKEFLLRFGLKDVSELPSMDEFEKMTLGASQDELFDLSPVADATGVPDHDSADEPHGGSQSESTSSPQTAGGSYSEQRATSATSPEPAADQEESHSSAIANNEA